MKYSHTLLYVSLALFVSLDCLADQRSKKRRSSKKQSTSSRVIEIKSEEQYDALVDKKGSRVIAKFYTTWCGGCSQIEKPFAELSRDPEFSSITFISIDCDKMRDLAHDLDVHSYPTIAFIQDGEIIESGTEGGSQFKSKMANKLRSRFKLAD